MSCHLVLASSHVQDLCSIWLLMHVEEILEHGQWVDAVVITIFNYNGLYRMDYWLLISLIHCRSSDNLPFLIYH